MIADGANSWLLTSGGRRVYPLAMEPAAVDPGDIAHALSLLCRFGGHCRTFYSVAQHSVLVARQLPAGLQLQGLLHDATEAYCGDVVRPLKRYLDGYAVIEAGIWSAIAKRFGLPVDLDPRVKEADNRMLLSEKRDLLRRAAHRWGIDQSADPAAAPYPFRIVPQRPDQARRAWKALFRQLTETAP